MRHPPRPVPKRVVPELDEKPMRPSPDPIVRIGQIILLVLAVLLLVLVVWFFGYAISRLGLLGS